MADIERKVWLISGASSGIGLAIAKAVLLRGDRVVLAARRLQPFEQLITDFDGLALATTLDVTVADQRDAAVASGLNRFGRIDTLVNAAGFGFFGAVEELTLEDIRQQFETNFFGAVGMIQAVLPHMRARRTGLIVNITSEGGLMAYPGAAAYNSSKFALEGLSEALAQEAAPLGIKVMIVEPGAFRTGFLGGPLRKAEHVISDYAAAAEVRNFAATVFGKEPGDPDRLAEALLAAIDAPEPPLHLVVGADAVAHVTAKLDRLRIDMAAWDSVSRATAFLDTEAPLAQPEITQIRGRPTTLVGDQTQKHSDVQRQ